MWIARHGIIESQTNLLLDNYTGIAAAYSVSRKLRTAYTGAAIRVRRSSDNIEQDIGFTSSNILDESALTTFIGSNNGFIVTWYDQSVNGKNATQSTQANQPRIVNAGTIDKQNGKPAIVFDGINDYLETTVNSYWDFLHSGFQYTAFGVQKAGNVADPEAIYCIWGTTLTVNNPGAYIAHDTRSSQSRDNVLVNVYSKGVEFNINPQNNGTTPANTQFLYYLLGIPNTTTVADKSAIGTNGGTAQKNSVLNGTGGTGSAFHPLYFGAARNASSVLIAYYTGNIQEQIIFNSDKSPNRSGIEKNINSFYTIY